MENQKKTLEEKILAYIEESGYPLELEILDILKKNNFTIHPSSYYPVENEGKIKEIDAIGIRFLEQKEQQSIGAYLTIECKKSTKNQWVFFKEENEYDQLELIDAQSDNPKLTDEASNVSILSNFVSGTDDCFAEMHYNNSTHQSRSYCEPFKKCDAPSTIYKGIMSVLSARKHVKKILVESSQKYGTTFYNSTTIHFCVIVFDGNLFIADKKDGGSFILEKANHVLLKTTDLVSGYNPFSDQLLVDIVHKDYFDSYLKIIQKDLEAFGNFIFKVLEKK